MPQGADAAPGPQYVEPDRLSRRCVRIAGSSDDLRHTHRGSASAPTRTTINELTILERDVRSPGRASE